MKIFYKILGSFSLFLAFAACASAATLTLSPSVKNVNVGDTFTVNVVLDTQSQSIDGVDLQALNYNPYNLQVIDADAGTAGVQISPGSLMANTLANSVDTTNGKIVFSQVTSGGSTYAGSGTLATITFKALVAGTANVTFNFTPGATTDSNVSSSGSDILNGVTNGQFIINNSTGNTLGINITNNTTVPSTQGGTSGTVSASAIANLILLTEPLFPGASDSQVTSLQTVLSLKGYLAANLATGFYGALTQAAVQRYQCDKSIICSGTPNTTGFGKIGPSTRAALNADMSQYGNISSTPSTTTDNTTSSATISASGTLTANLLYGSAGSQVSILQTLLARDPSIYPEGTVNGRFGPATLRAVRRFQTRYNIVGSSSGSYGRVGPATRAKISAILGN